MINYSTEFPIGDGNSIEDVIHLAYRWIGGSPHTEIPKESLKEFPLNSEIDFTFGNERVIVGAAEFEDFSIGGLRYLRTDNNLEWVASIVTTKTIGVQLVSVQVSCEALNTAARLPIPKKPYFIKSVLKEFGGGMDGAVPVAAKPIFLDEDEAYIAAELITGTAMNRLPIVYVSASYNGSYIIDPAHLATFLSGMGHVIVEPSRQFSVDLRARTASRNVYGGTVGVYWPESNARKSYYLYKNSTTKLIQREIFEDIRIALCNRRPIANCNWLHLKETLSKCRYEKLKNDGSTELNQYVDAFDVDLKAKESKIEEAEREIARLNAELRKYITAHYTPGGILNYGEEQDLCEGEILDIVIEAMAYACQNAHEDGRRQHVLLDLIKHNHLVGKRTEIEEEIKTVFRAYRDMDARIKGVLTKLGFNLSEDGKHHKAVFQGDGRYTFSLPKSSSDHRAGKNLASDINKKLF